MFKKKYLLVTLLLLALLMVVGCSGDDGGSTKNEDLNLITLEDDFSDSTTGWSRITKEDYNCAYVDNKYQISIEQDKADKVESVWAYAPLDSRLTSDYSAQVDLVSMKNMGAFGFIFNYTESDYYYFRINPIAQEYAVHRVTSNDFKTVIDWTSSAKIEEGIRIKISQTGDQASFYINGDQIDQASIEEHTDGVKVALLASNYEAGDSTKAVTATFDNFKLNGYLKANSQLSGLDLNLNDLNDHHMENLE